MNGQNLVIRFRKRNDFEKLIFLMFFVNFAEGFLSIFIPQIHFIYYLVDVMNIVLVIALFRRKKITKIHKNDALKVFRACFCVFLVFAVFGVIINFSNLFLHLWGIRSVFTNWFFFIACISFKKSDDIDFLNKLFWINLFTTVMEIAIGYRQDWVGGIYGVSQGQVNGPLNILLIIFLIKVVIEYINKKTTISKVLFYITSILVIATFAELKIFYVELIAIIALCSLVTKFSFKKLILFILGLIGFLVGIRVIFIVFPDIDRQMFSLNYMWNYLTNKGGYVGQFANNAGDMNRLAFWDKSMQLLENNFNRILGLGIGNCDNIQMISMQSTFYQQHNALHYYFFPLAMTLLQQGIIGLVLYITMFIMIFLAIIKRRREEICEQKSPVKYQMAEVLCLMAFVITIYDTSLFGRGGYLFYYILALPFVNTSRLRGKV